MRSEWALPHVSRGRLIAFSLLGRSLSQEPDSPPTLSLLNALAQTATNALDTRMLLEDLHRSHLLMKRTDRLKSLETIAGGFAHEIRNPLTSIKTFIQLAPERKDDPDFIREFSRIVLDDVYRIERLIEEILDYARYMEPKLTEEDPNDIVSSCLYFIEVKADSRGIKIEKELVSDLPRVMLDRQQIKQVFLNLFLNALDAMSEKRRGSARSDEEFDQARRKVMGADRNGGYGSGHSGGRIWNTSSIRSSRPSMRAVNMKAPASA